VNTVTISAFDGASPANIGTATIQIILGVPVVASPLAIRPFMS
jgi:hypothetical protein